MEDIKPTLSQCNQFNNDDSTLSLTELKELAKKLAAVGDELADVYSSTLNGSSQELTKNVLRKFLVNFVMALV